MKVSEVNSMIKKSLAGNKITISSCTINFTKRNRREELNKELIDYFDKYYTLVDTIYNRSNRQGVTSKIYKLNSGDLISLSIISIEVKDHKTNKLLILSKKPIEATNERRYIE